MHVFGKRPIAALGMLMIATASMLALLGLELFHFLGPADLLGVGWNFGFIGATALLTECFRPAERAKVQAAAALPARARPPRSTEPWWPARTVATGQLAKAHPAD